MPFWNHTTNLFFTAQAGNATKLTGGIAPRLQRLYLCSTPCAPTLSLVVTYRARYTQQCIP
jgi:hypothetical protein